MDLEDIPLEKQVNLILLSKVVKNNLALKKKTNISLYQIHRILQNKEAILEAWKRKSLKTRNNTDYTNAADTLLLEWVRQCKLQNLTLPALMIHEQVKYLTELFGIFYKINMKIWTQIRTILGHYCYSNGSTQNKTPDIYDIFEKDGKKLLKAEIYEEFLERLDVNMIKKNSRKSIENKSPSEKLEAIKECNGENKNDDEVIAIEKPITIVDIRNDDIEFCNKIAKIKSEPLSPPISDHHEVVKEANFSPKDFEPPDREPTKEIYIKQEPQEYNETESENPANHLEDEINEFEEFLYITDNSTNVVKLESDNEITREPSNIKHEPPEVEGDKFEKIVDEQLEFLNRKLSDNSTEIKEILNLGFGDDNDSECIEIFQIVESEEDDLDKHEEKSPHKLNKNEKDFNRIKKKPIEIEFSDYDCLQIKLGKTCDRTIKPIIKEENKAATNEEENNIKLTEVIEQHDDDDEEEESEETQIELEIEDSEEDGANELREIINKYAKENNGNKTSKPESLLKISQKQDVSPTEKVRTTIESSLQNEPSLNPITNLVNSVTNVHRKELSAAVEQQPIKEEEDEQEEECEIVLEIVSDEEDDDDNIESIIDLLKSKEIENLRKRPRVHKAKDKYSSTPLSHLTRRKIPRF